jgi:hypothetical protein
MAVGSKIKNFKRIFSQDGFSASTDTRISNLENNVYKITYYEVVSGASGTLTVPSQATINPDEFGLSGNALLSKIDINNKPTYESPLTLGNTVVTASLNTTTGAWAASGAYTDLYVALIYSIDIKAEYFSNLNNFYIIETASLRLRGTQTLQDVTDLGNITTHPIEADYFITTGGTSSDFVKGDGSLSRNGINNIVALGTDTYTATLTGITSYINGDCYLVRFPNGNTTGCTLNINGLGAIQLYRNNDGPLIGGDIEAGAEMLCVYNSTANTFQCIGTSPNSIIAYVTNTDSVTITKGQPVYAFGGTGDRMTVKLANNVGDATSAQTVGLVLSTSIATNQKGFIMMQGLLDGLSILPTATWTDGDPVYLGSTAGAITNVKPYAPNHLVYLGFVTTASNGSAGRMYVRVQNGYELDELHNVQAQSPSLKDTLWYDNTVSPGQWKTASLATILGYTPVPDTRNLTINGTTYDLTADRSWTISTASNVAIKDEGTTLTSAVTSIDFTGSAVTATAVGNDVTVNINAGGAASFALFNYYNFI